MTSSGMGVVTLPPVLPSTVQRAIFCKVAAAECCHGRMGDMPALTLHPDRLFPAETTTRDVARRLYETVKDLPIISPHGHVPPQWIADNTPWTDPTSLLLSPDHYINRLLHAHGVQEPVDVVVGAEQEAGGVGPGRIVGDPLRRYVAVRGDDR